MARVKQNTVNYNGLEVETDEVTVAGVDAGLSVTMVDQVESTLDNDIVGTTAEDGYLHFEKDDGTVVKVPYWLDD